MKIHRYIIMAALAVAGLSSCENDGFYYQDEPRVRLVGDVNWTLGTDSLELSFTAYAGDEAPIEVDACIIGNVASYDRTVNLEVDEAKTTATADLYDVPQTVTIPANQAKATFNVVLRNAARLQTGGVQLYIKVVASEDFAVGVNEENHLLLKWNDVLTKPVYWSEIEEHFGAYSDVKYRFMLDCLLEKGYSTNLDPSAAGLNWAALHNFNIMFANMLRAYNEAHPGAPLTDENGAIVTF